MYYPKLAYHKLSGYIDISFIVKFIFLLAGLYYFNLFFIGITDPKGMLYSSFLTNYLDYISWLRSAILHTANFFTKGFGLNTYVADIYTLKVTAGQGLRVGLTCIGYGLMSFWTAFIVAQNIAWKKKITWCLAGLAAIWFINCWRVALLLIALQNKWAVSKYMDHHDMFNLIAYLLIILMICLFYKQSKKDDDATLAVPVSNQDKQLLHLAPDVITK